MVEPLRLRLQEAVPSARAAFSDLDPAGLPCRLRPTGWQLLGECAGFHEQRPKNRMPRPDVKAFDEVVTSAR